MFAWFVKEYLILVELKFMLSPYWLITTWILLISSCFLYHIHLAKEIEEEHSISKADVLLHMKYTYALLYILHYISIGAQCLMLIEFDWGIRSHWPHTKEKKAIWWQRWWGCWGWDKETQSMCKGKHLSWLLSNNYQPSCLTSSVPYLQYYCVRDRIERGQTFCFIF